DFLPLDGLQVDRERTLPAVHHREGIRDLVDEWRHRPHVVAELRVLDLDDVRAEVAQELRAERPREEAREIQDRDALEGRRHGGSKSRSRYQSSCTPDLPVAVLRCIRNLRYRRGRELAEVEAIRHVICGSIALAQSGAGVVPYATLHTNHMLLRDD